MELQRTLAPKSVDDISAREAESRLRWDRKDVDALFTRAASLASAGRTDEAVSCLDRIAELAPDHGVLAILNWDGASLLTEEARKAWTTPTGTRAFGVFALDVEPDTATEILTVGHAWDPTTGQRTGQLRIWNWNLP